MLHDCLDINEEGHLTIGGADTVSLAAEFGTPAYIMDENTVRRMCRLYRDTMRECYGDDGSMPLFAGKALCFKEIYRIIASEGIGADVVSPGELYTALEAGFPAEKLYFHGNNKTDADIRFGVEKGVGCFVADCREELDAIEREGERLDRRVRILLRITPGIDPHTHRKIITGSVDSKFGSAIETGQALDIVKYALSLPHIELDGLHCHIGSQIFDCQPFYDAAEVMLHFISELKAKLGFTARTLNLGGGFGVRYIAEHPLFGYATAVRNVAEHIKKICGELGIDRPRILMEPGRSVVAAAGITLYTVGSVKEIPGFRNYVSVDGGMPDNPRYALYASQYTALVADRAGETADYRCTIAGRCCESGDLIGEDMTVQRPHRGDTLAILVTGAYNYSMASNYNRIPRPPVVLIRDGIPRVAVRRESYEDLVRNDL